MLGRSEKDAKDLVAKAIEYYYKNGRWLTLAEISNPKGSFVEDEMYVFVMNRKGTVLAHGADEKYIGQDFVDIKDSDGRRFIMEIVEKANDLGSSFVEYTWHNPMTGMKTPKHLYFEKFDDLIFCSGVYKKMWEDQY